MSIIRASKNDVKHLITLIQNRFGNVDNTADANKNVASAAKWTTARNINGMTVDGSANRTNYGTCSTAAATAAKTVACTGFALVTGAEITVKFTVTNSASSPTLNVNGTGAKAIYYRGSAITAGYLAANRTYTFRYNGTQYDLVGDVDTNSTYSAAGTSLGLVKSGGDVTISNGTITVNDDSHNHTIGNVDGLQTALDGKLGKTATAAAATKLANARDINLSGDASGSASFNGTQDVTISVTIPDMVAATSVADGKAGFVPAPSTGEQNKFLRGDGTWQTPSNTTYSTGTATKSGLTKLYTGTGTNTDGTMTQNAITTALNGKAASSHDHEIADVTGLQGALDGKLSTTGTAASATKLATARTISLGGDATGSTTFDGSANKTITVTIADMEGASSNAAGKAGFVPAPLAGYQGRYLRGDGTWATPTNTTYSNMTGATTSTAGKSGLVPAPAAGSATRYLRSDGTWSVPPDTNTTYSDMKGATSSANGTHGLVPQPDAGEQTKFLRGDGTWQTPPNTTYGAAGTSLGLVKSGGDVTISNGVITINDDSHNHTIANVDGLQTALNGKLSTSGTAAKATQLSNSRSFSITGGATASAVSFNGTGNVALNVTSLDATKLSGTVPLANLPAGALERLVTVENQTARFALTTSDVQLGDTVQQLDTGIMYLVIDTAELDNANGYKEYTAGTATKVPWSGVTGKPSTFTPSTHTHTIANVSGLQSELDSKIESLSDLGVTATVAELNKLDGVTATATELNYVDGVTSNIQTQLNSKAASNHTHSTASTSAAGFLRQLNGSTSNFLRGDGTWATPPNTTYSDMKGATSSAAGTRGLVPAPAAGNQAKFLRGDGTWQTPTNTTYSTFKAATSSAAGGSGLVPAPAQGYQSRFLRGDATWQAISLSTFGVTATAAELNKLDGVTATATEINYLDGVTSSIQTQLNGKAASSHTHDHANITGLTASRALVSDSSGHPTVSAVTSTELGYLDGVTSNIQTQLNGKLSTSGTAAAATKLATARNINGLSFDGTANRVNYGSCSTAAGTAAKTVSCSGFSLVTGAEITVKFTVTNTAANPTLNVNSTGAKAIYYNGAAISARYLKANKTYSFRYNGTQYDLVGDIDTNTTYSLSSFGVTATAAELNKLDGLATTKTELGYLDGVTSNVQTQLNGKLSTSGTAAAASKLATARTITLSGDASGSVSFDGSANVTLTATVKDDSHSHTIANVDNLQTTLNGKATQTQIRDVKEATLTSAGWSGSGPYTQSVTVTGISASDTPLIECIADVNSASEKRLMQQQWNKVDYIECAANKITATCNFDKPTVNLSLRIKGI